MKKWIYINRNDAGQYLADQLKKFEGTDSVVLAVPRGGVPVACPIAQTLHLPLDLLLVKKIGHRLILNWPLARLASKTTLWLTRQSSPNITLKMPWARYGKT